MKVQAFEELALCILWADDLHESLGFLTQWDPGGVVWTIAIRNLAKELVMELPSKTTGSQEPYIHIQGQKMTEDSIHIPSFI